MSPSFSSDSWILRQLVYDAPMLLACLVGIVLALINLATYRLPAFLTLGGIGLILIALATKSLFVWFFITRASSGGSFATYANYSMIMTVAMTCLHAAGLVLVLAAVFVARKQRDPGPHFAPPTGY